MNYTQDAKTGAETIIAYKGEPDETPYYKVSGDVYADEFYSFLIKTSRPVDDEEMGQLCSLIGFRYRMTVGGEGLGWPDRLTDDTFVIQADSTKGSLNGIGDFVDGLNDFIATGTDIRKTNRAGEGTKNTRAINGIENLTIDFYCGSVLKFITTPLGARK